MPVIHWLTTGSWPNMVVQLNFIIEHKALLAVFIELYDTLCSYRKVRKSMASARYGKTIAIQKSTHLLRLDRYWLFVASHQ